VKGTLEKVLKNKHFEFTWNGGKSMKKSSILTQTARISPHV
jgi:hypothetical protein